MWRVGAVLASALLFAQAAAAQQVVRFPSLDGAAGKPATQLDGYLFRAPGEGRHPAVVFLHGCGGLISRRTGRIGPRELGWARVLNGRGYTVLMVDSFRPRGVGGMCAPANYRPEIVAARPKDAYGALYYLQKQPFVRGARIGLIGWSAGGGTVLWTIPRQSLGRPAALPQGDFRAAVAFYPAKCRDDREPASWTSDIPLLILVGSADVWTPAAPCRSFVAGAVARGATVELQVYPGAYHDFDWPDLPRREMPQFRTVSGVVPIEATDPSARADALSRIPAFLGRFLGN